MERLSQLLHVADQLANDIREEIARPREGEPPVEGAPLTGPSIAFLYERAFGEPAPGYLVQSTLREFSGTPVRADGLDAVLKDQKFLEKLSARYEDLRLETWN